MITKFCCFPSKILSSLSLFLHATAIARPVIPWLNLYNILPNDVPDCCVVSFSFSTFSKTQMWLCLVAQSCPSLCNPIGCSPSGSSVRGDSPVKNTGLGCHVLLQGIFPTQGLKPGLPHCRRILYQLSHKGSLRILGWGSLSLLQGIFLTQELNQHLQHCK